MGKYRSELVIKLASAFRQRQIARVARQQGDAENLFQCFDMQADHRLTQAEIISRPGKAAAVDDGKESVDLIEMCVHEIVHFYQTIFSIYASRFS